MARIARDMTWLIGRTPLVELARVSPEGCRVVAKLEAMNPTCSNKDRAALGMIEHAERTGFLPDLAIHLTLMAPFLEFRGPFAIDELGRHIGEHVMLIAHPRACCRERIFHCAFPPVAFDRLSRAGRGAILSCNEHETGLVASAGGIR